MELRCPNCGAEVKPGAQFCEECGFKMIAQPSVPRPTPSPAPAGAPTPAPTPKPAGTPAPAPAPKAAAAAAPAAAAPAAVKKKKKNNKIILFGILGFVLVALIAGLILFLTWKFTVSFDSAGGSAVVEQKIGRGNPAKRPDDPVMDGFDFLGWYLEDKEYNFNQPVKKSFTLTAHWSESKFITFVVDGSEIAREHVVNGRVTFPQAPQKDGYAFVCWQDESGAEITEDKVFSDNMTLTARYKVFIPITSIKFEKAQYVMERDSTLKPKLIIQPSNWVETLGFTTSNAAVATVDGDGVITANGGGTAVITVTSESGKSASCEIDVKVSCKTLKYKLPEVIIQKGTKMTPEIEINPEDTTEQVKYTSSDKKIVTVNEETGEIEGVGYGTATITATAGKAKATLKVTVNNPATKISVASPVTVVAGESVALKVTLTPLDSTSTLSYVSNDESIAKVDAEGNVTGVKGGKTTITVKTDNGLTAKADIKVNEYTLNITLDQSGTVVENYLFYSATNAPVIRISKAELVVNEAGTTKTVNVDLGVLSLTGADKAITLNNGVLAAANVTKASTKEIAFQCKYDSHTITSKKFTINVEPELKVVSVNPGSLSGSVITLPESEEAVEFTVKINQKVSAGGYKNLTKKSATTHSDSTELVLRKEPDSATGEFTLTTKGGQKLTVTVN